MSVILDRLAPQDLHRQIDWLRDEWGEDEEVVAKKLVRLRRMFEHLPSRYYEQTTEPLEALAHARLVRNADYMTPLRRLNEIVAEWGRNRPELLTCDVCGVQVRGRNTWREHVRIFHDGKEGE